MSSIPGALLRILVVDDDPAMNRMISMTLRCHGFGVASALNGFAGLAEVEAQHPDIIILDLEMPVMDGRTFFRELRARGDSTPVLVASAYGARAAALELCAEGYLAKPFHPDELADKIRSIGLRRNPSVAGARSDQPRRRIRPNYSPGPENTDSI